jgi:hypothetical protein
MLVGVFTEGRWWWLLMMRLCGVSKLSELRDGEGGSELAR